MNMNKRDRNGWVLCPSQRFPGKFYFFNTLSGEAVWSLNELEVSWNILRHFCALWPKLQKSANALRQLANPFKTMVNTSKSCDSNNMYAGGFNDAY